MHRRVVYNNIADACASPPSLSLTCSTVMKLQLISLLLIAAATAVRASVVTDHMTAESALETLLNVQQMMNQLGPMEERLEKLRKDLREVMEHPVAFYPDRFNDKRFNELRNQYYGAFYRMSKIADASYAQVSNVEEWLPEWTSNRTDPNYKLGMAQVDVSRTVPELKLMLKKSDEAQQRMFDQLNPDTSEHYRLFEVIKDYVYVHVYGIAINTKMDGGIKYLKEYVEEHKKQH